jgi:hypothetical protein
MADIVEIGFKTTRKELEEEFDVEFTDSQWSNIKKAAFHADGEYCSNINHWLTNHIKEEVLRDEDKDDDWKFEFTYSREDAEEHIGEKLDDKTWEAIKDELNRRVDKFLNRTCDGLYGEITDVLYDYKKKDDSENNSDHDDNDQAKIQESDEDKDDKVTWL